MEYEVNIIGVDQESKSGDANTIRRATKLDQEITRKSHSLMVDYGLHSNKGKN